MQFIFKLLRFALIGFGALVSLYFIAALIFTLLPEPAFASEPLPGGIINSDSNFDTTSLQFTMRDGESLFAREYTADSPTTILFLHGVTADSRHLSHGAQLLQRKTGATVVTLDLRGHGQSAGRPGDVAYIGQYEEDIADVISAIQQNNPNGTVILAGHSMGGGIGLRYAMLNDAPAVDGYLFFAPHLGANSPTVATESSDGANGGEAFVQIHLMRIIGLAMLNGTGIKGLNGKDTLFFNLSDDLVHTYSYRAMVNSSPAEYVAALTAVDKPMLVLVGSQDEAFIADQFQTTVESHSNGKVKLIPGETHNGIYLNEEAMTAVQDWLSTSISMQEAN